MAPLFRPVVIPTGGPAAPDRNGGIWPRTGGTPGAWRDFSTALRSARNDKKGRDCARNDRVGRRFARDNRRIEAFTLIELLVVISIVVLLLMVLLLPALSRAKKQAQAVVCQARLRQAATSMQVAIENNGGRFPDCDRRVSPGTSQDDGPSNMPHMLAPFAESPELALCPLATRTTQPESDFQFGGTFSAYSAVFHEGTFTGSYGENLYIGESEHDRQGVLSAPYTARGGSSVPYFLDGMWWWTTCGPLLAPPPYEGETEGFSGMRWNCINRHQGGVNALFLDFSARKVGLKELWTLKWHRGFDTAGPWTKAGGVQREDWPQWMRKFKDY